MIAFKNVTYLRAGVAALALLSATSLQAQQNGASQPDSAVSEPAAADVATQENAAAASDTEIVVTARRRNELLLDVPIAVTAYSGEQLDRQGALDITDIADTTPNVTIETSRGTNSTLTAFIRGVGQQDPVAGFEQGVGIYIDDVYLNRPQLALLDIYDVERIEVLRGPQGTLYGRNTIGGAIKYVTRRLSDDPAGSVRVNYGSYNQLDMVMTASTPLAAGLKVGGAIAGLTREGFGKNLTTGRENYDKDVTAARGTIEFEPSANIFGRITGDYTWDDSAPRNGYAILPSLLTNTPVLDDEFDTRGALDEPKQRIRGGGLSGRLEIGLGNGLSLRSITAFRKDKSETPIDFDALPTVDVDVAGLYENEQFSQEAQLLVERGPLNGLFGVYYLDADARTAFDTRAYTTGALLGLPALTLGTDSKIGTKTWAAFADFTYDVTEQLSVSGGLRYTSDKRTGDIVRTTYIAGGSPLFGGEAPFDVGIPVATTSDFQDKRKDTAWTPRASIAFKPNDNHNIYLSYSRGFKGGGFDPRGQTSQSLDQTPEGIFEYIAFEPETVDSIEVGWKGAAIDRRLQWAVAAFNADYKDVQIPASVPCVNNGIPTFCGLTSNAGKARFRGLELETSLRAANDFIAPGDRLNLSGSLGYLNAKYKEFLSVVAFDEETGAPIAPIEVDVAEYRKVQNTPKWTASATLDYNVPITSGQLNFNTTVSYRGASQQFEVPIPGLDQGGFSLWDANLVWRSADSRWSLGLHGKNLTDKRYIAGGYNFYLQNPYTGEFILPTGAPGLFPAVGVEGVLTGFYGNPRQIFVSAGLRF
ncbi:MAG TPA: TonB-dependent receptor [Sphingomicrobium sp.]|nr:TonB-dependent receptor [Sphingomicrobium sp.]